MPCKGGAETRTGISAETRVGITLRDTWYDCACVNDKKDAARTTPAEAEASACRLYPAEV